MIVSRENQIGYNGNRLDSQKSMSQVGDRRYSSAIGFSAIDVVSLPVRKQTPSGKTLCELPTVNGNVQVTGRVADILYTLEGSSRYRPVAGPTIASALEIPADSLSSAVRRAANHRDLARTTLAIGLPEGKKTGYYLRDTSLPEFPVEEALIKAGVLSSDVDVMPEVAILLLMLTRGERVKAREILEQVSFTGSQESGLRKVRRLKDAARPVLNPEWEICSYVGKGNAGYELVRREVKETVLFNG